MMQVPLLGNLESPFKGQVLCTQDLFDNKTLVVLAHEFGNLRLELESAMTCDLNLERSYLLDFTKELMRWINAEGYALIDVNLYPKPFSSVQQPKRFASKKISGRYDEALALLTYLWDNYIHLSQAQKIIFIGHGPACQPLIDLIDARFNSITKNVKGVIQIVGYSKVPVTPKKSDELRAWYAKRSCVLLPASHHILRPEGKYSQKKHGILLPVEELQPVKVVMKGLPAIQAFIKSQVE